MKNAVFHAVFFLREDRYKTLIKTNKYIKEKSIQACSSSHQLMTESFLIDFFQNKSKKSVSTDFLKKKEEK